VRVGNVNLEPIVIELPPRPKMPKFTFTPEQSQLMAAVSSLSRQLAQDELPPEQRAALQKELGEKQARMHASLEGTRRQFEKEMEEAQVALREHNELREKIRHQQIQQRLEQRELEAAATQSQRDVLTKSLQDTAREQDRLRELIKPGTAARWW
jgi:septal ring factor EnvC (AmiA/AmiB activator)